ncbi:MAG: efflux RND transporter periplasmic adaptor subunit [Bacteroidaceae bacterium]|nr:efflux RND transporter periplasmic adaptor subunit [Bacteroidaceae bacterium]MBO5784945.1 efflux RND transporter periplasmic adaptor subunit [Bacteroidaceae bacterium]MBO5886163.1 efflux RND transporter periplasmic adaptor subunit [Bacteroidaceae bacterium]MBO7171627.1 efflux RND transporter periplasmic adaptor subunit [Bacteroidaceae bacterium]
MKKSIILSSILLTMACASEKEETKIPEAQVQEGVFQVDLFEEGQIEAFSSININAPNLSWRFGNLKIAELVEDGTQVKAGDTVCVFDPSEVNKAILESEDRLIVSRAEMEKMLAQHQLDMENLQAEHRTSEITFEITRMQLESAAHESDIKRREIELNLEKAKIALGRAKEQIENRRRIHQEEQKQMQLSIDEDEARLQEAHETLSKLFLVSPADGIAIISHNWSTQNKYQIGDQMWPSNTLMQLPNLSKLKTKINVNEVDISYITRDLRVEVKPDAFSDSTFTGRVIHVANLAVNKDNNSNIKVFPVEILLDQTHKNLLPGLTVSCRVVIDEIENVQFIPLEALHTDGNIKYVYRRKGGEYERVEVQTGLTNSDYVIITEGLKPKDHVALIDPTKLEEQQKNASEGK